MGNGLIGQFHVRGQTSRHRHAEDAAFHEPRPFARLVDRVLEGYFVFAVQRFGDSAGYGRQRAKAIIAEVRAVGRKYADRKISPPYRAK